MTYIFGKQNATCQKHLSEYTIQVQKHRTNTLKISNTNAILLMCGFITYTDAKLAPTTQGLNTKSAIILYLHAVQMQFKVECLYQPKYMECLYNIVHNTERTTHIHYYVYCTLCIHRIHVDGNPHNDVTATDPMSTQTCMQHNLIYI